ncbi:porin [Marinobacter similis]|uniref:Membrane protein n=1 Tax=Marinobacter similis TaxID=1420916 RepID=W5YJK5_9GAMM|nr:porin [Marinobacter similis]AHI29266.1 membrane protein [Marinobacter similis]
MKKTLIASAIAAATFSGAAFAADGNMSASELAAKMDSMPQVYGNIQYAVDYTDIDGSGSGLDHFDNGTTLGVKHDHEIMPGLTGFLKLELEGINANNKASSSGIDSLDEAYVGVMGDGFGQLWVGSDDSLYESSIAKIANFHEIGTGLDGSYTTGEGDLIQYKTPSFGGLTLGAAVQINGETDAESKSYPYQLAATYAVDAFELAVAMDSNDGNTGYSKDGFDGEVVDPAELDDNNENTYGVRATYSMDNVSVTGEYQTRKDVSKEFGVIGVYSMGANQFSAAYQVVEDDAPGASNGDKEDVIALQALHNVSDHMYVYVESFFYSADNDNEYAVGADQKTRTAVGAVYYF